MKFCILIQFVSVIFLQGCYSERIKIYSTDGNKINKEHIRIDKILFIRQAYNDSIGYNNWLFLKKSQKNYNRKYKSVKKEFRRHSVAYYINSEGKLINDSINFTKGESLYRIVLNKKLKELSEKECSEILIKLVKKRHPLKFGITVNDVIIRNDQNGNLTGKVNCYYCASSTISMHFTYYKKYGLIWFSEGVGRSKF